MHDWFENNSNIETQFKIKVNDKLASISKNFCLNELFLLNFH